MDIQSLKNYDFSEREEHWRKYWQKNQIYKFDKNSDKPIFSVDTPPPYVSAEHLHSGHIMSYSQAEFVVRFKRMKGYNVFYPMGFDDNGLPTERFVEKKYNIDKSKISRSEFIQKCLEETRRGAENYKNLWMLLGISVDWDKTYSTINEHCRKIAQWSFLDLFQKRKISRKEEPIHWCVLCQTALAQADLEDKEEDSFMNYIEFKGEDGSPLLVATTRPELIPACVALFVNPDDKRFSALKGKNAVVPIFDYQVPILADESVDKNVGTGLMMVCTFGDAEDVHKWKRHSLRARLLFDEKGILSELGGKYQGLSISDARKKILKDLKEKRLLKKQEKVTHTYNTHERCGAPAEFIVTKQWFIDILNIKDELLKRGEELRWFPEHMKNKYRDWVKAIRWDWCVSRQRYFGVPFPVWYCKSCGEIILAQEKDLPVDPIEQNPAAKKCEKCGGAKFAPESDVMDTWMTSSLTPLIAAKLVGDENLQKKLCPSVLRPQAFEIIRTWLFYTIVKFHYHFNSLPFSETMISGHGLDEQGRKISKRFGNYIIPSEIISKYGADALRYWATGATLGENMRYSEEEVKKGKRTVTKIWNAAKFCFSHFEGFDPTDEEITFENLEPADRWIVGELNEAILESEKHFEQYEYSKARNKIDYFFWNLFSDNYLEFVKYRLYGDDIDKNSKKAVKQTLYKCFLSVIKMYAPILPFITEEIYQTFFKTFPIKEQYLSAHLSRWPSAESEASDEKKIKEEFLAVIAVIARVRKFKSEKGVSLGKEIEEFVVPESINIEKYGEFIRKVGKVNKIKQG